MYVYILDIIGKYTTIYEKNTKMNGIIQEVIRKYWKIYEHTWEKREKYDEKRRILVIMMIIKTIGIIGIIWIMSTLLIFS